MDKDKTTEVEKTTEEQTQVETEQPKTTVMTEAERVGKSTKQNEQMKDNLEEQSKENSEPKVDKEAVRAEIFKELGITQNDKNIAMFKKFMKMQEEDEKETTQTDPKLAELEHRAMVAEFKAEVLAAGVKTSYIDDAVTLMLSKKEQPDFKLSNTIGEFKKKYPEWFAADDLDGTGSTMKSRNAAGGDKNEKSLGARLAAQRKPSTTKKSFWGN